MTRKRRNLEQWLHYQPHEYASAIAARAGLRVASLLAERHQEYGPRDLRRSHQVLTGFRVLAAAWCAAKYPQRTELRSAAGKAARARAHFNAALHDPACACALAVIGPISATYAASAVAVVDIAARDYGYPGAEEDASAACATDADLLTEGVPPSTLIDRPIWHEGPPPAALQQWRSFKSWLGAPEENWEVWTEWYEARLYGDQAHEALEQARVLEPAEKEWLAGAAIANSRLKQIMARFPAPS